MVTWGEIKRWQPSPLQNAVGPMNNAYNKVIGCSDDLRDINTPYGWFGTAATAAAQQVNQMIDGLEEYSAEVAAGRRSVGDTGDAITGVLHGVHDAEGIAAAHHFAIADDGAIVDSGPPPGTPEDQRGAVARERQRIATELRDRVDQVIRSATDVDDDFCAVLDEILSGHTIDATANDNQSTSLAAAGNSGFVLGSLTIPAPPPEGATAAQNAAYWSTLSEGQRTRLAMDRPELVGNRDGFSAVQRDIANRTLLDRQRTQLQSQRDALQHRIDSFPRSGGGQIKLNDQHKFDAMKAELKQLDGKLKGVDALGGRLNQPPGTPEGQRYYLLGIDTSDDGKAILAKGNPDTATNVATYVPGTTSDLATFGDEASRGDIMHAAAERVGSPSTSVITWLGYDAPDGLTNAVSESYAENGKDAFAGFEDGLRESHQGPPSHNTAIGHSYGTTLIGHAAVDERVPVDEMVFVASPGVGADNPAQLHMSPDHVYSTVAKNDLINITNVPGVGGALDPLGPDPAAKGFGGRTFQSDPGTSTGGLPTSAAHGEYWNRNNPSLEGMGLVISGSAP
jgi:alpha/beta hydrolase family protein